MEFVIILSKMHGLSPFNVLNSDSEQFIMLINHYIERVENEEPEKQKKIVGKQERIRVNDTTATGGWF